MVFPILTITGEERGPLIALRRVSLDVTEFSEELRELVASMVETMFGANGVALAAPQIGRNLNLFVMRTHAGNARRNRGVRVVINPVTINEIGEDVGPTSEKVEGCLSIPGILGRVARFHEVDCIYWDENGKRNAASLKGIEARIYQHERDHLCGVLFVDRAEAFYPVGYHEKETHPMQMATVA
jgi:peptide deformylase